MCDSEHTKALKIYVGCFCNGGKIAYLLIQNIASQQFVHAPIWFIDCCIYAVGTEGFHRDQTGSEKEARELMIHGMIIIKRK